jgi:hypothetical protein
MASSYTLPGLPCSLPTYLIPENINLESVASKAIEILGDLRRENFLDDAIWRDSFAMTGTLRTFYSATSVFEAWTETSKTHNPGHFVVAAHPKVMRPPNSAWIDVMFNFETRGQPSTLCSGFLSVVPTEGGVWKIWMLRTILEQLKSQPSVDVLEPVYSSHPNSSTDSTVQASGKNCDTHGNGGNSLNNVNEANENNVVKEAVKKVKENLRDGSLPASTESHFDCVVVGGGQAGLSTGGRLKALGVSYVILEKHARVGDSWGTRYDSTKCRPPLSVLMHHFQVTTLIMWT